MELTSPGIEHNIKNAAEFSIFIGRNVRVWDKTVTDWVGGTIKSSDEKSVIINIMKGSDPKCKNPQIESLARCWYW